MGGAPPGTSAGDRWAQGRELYLTSCVSCHGVGGVGTADGPSLAAAGEASADFYLRTGRMPLAPADNGKKLTVWPRYPSK